MITRFAVFPTTFSFVDKNFVNGFRNTLVNLRPNEYATDFSTAFASKKLD